MKFLTARHKKWAQGIVISFIVLGAVNFFRDRIFEELINIFSPRAFISINVTEIKEIDKGGRIDGGFHLVYSTASGKAAVAMIKKGDLEKNKRFGLATVPLETIAKPGQHEYVLNITNTGKKTATNIVVDIQSTSQLAILEKDPRITANCGELFVKLGCHIEIKQLVENEILAFGMLSSGSGIDKIQSSIDGNLSQVAVNNMNFDLIKYEMIKNLEIEGKNIIFPPINTSEYIRSYYYQPPTNNWRELELSERDRQIHVRKSYLPTFNKIPEMGL